MTPEKLAGIRRRVREWDMSRVFGDRADLLDEVDALTQQLVQAKSDGWDECAQWHETYHLRHGEPPLFDTAAHANPHREGK